LCAPSLSGVVGLVALITANLGVIVFSGLSIALIGYLIHSMLHPEGY
jgi:hypothetical protein